MYSHHSTYADTLREIADFFNLELLMPIIQVSTWYTDNSQDSNSVLDPTFLCANAEEFNKYINLPDLCSISDYALLSINIIIKEELIQDKKQTIIKNSKEGKEFVNEFRGRIGYIGIVNIWDELILLNILKYGGTRSVTKT